MNDDETRLFAIVADVGGTFARLSRVNLITLQMDMVEIYSCAEFINFEAVFRAYQMQHSLQQIKQVSIAIACPVLGDWVCMTNGHWEFSIQALKNSLGLTQLKVLNDFTAIALSLSVLSEHQKLQIGSGCADSNKVSLVLGAGTGLGVGYLIPGHQEVPAYAGEGGHADWGAQTEQEWFIYQYLKKRYAHVSYERILSGQGLEHLYQAIAAYLNQPVSPLKAAEIISLALDGCCVIAQAVISQFFASLGSYAGDLALIFGAFGGVYLAGGIIPRLLSLIGKSAFRMRFEEKGRFSHFNAQIPTYLISAEQPGMIGAAVALKHLNATVDS